MFKLSALELRDLFLKGGASAEEIARHFLERVSAIDPKIGGFLQLLPERALRQAQTLDQKRSRGEPLGKLAGVPIGIKDNIHIQGELTTCGSKFLENYRAPFDATLTKLLEEEGAILIGKTNLDEFAMGSTTGHSAYQKTRNPWDLERIPGGSSGGSAAVVSARLCPIAFGSDTGGSIRQPASLCGVVGYKPTYGRVSRYGLVAFGSSLDQIGPFANRVSDIGLVMEVIGRHDAQDATSLPLPQESYLTQFDGNLKGIKIGALSNFLEGIDPEVGENFQRSLQLLRDQGASIVPIELPMLKYALAVYYILAAAEASTNLARFDGIRYGKRSPRANTLREIYTLSKEEGYGAEVKRRILLGTYVLSAGYQDAYYRKAQKVRTLLQRDYAAAFSKCHAIAMPVSPTPAPLIGALADPMQEYLADIYTVSANLVGVPGVSVPAGFSKENLPIGLQLQGPQQGDVQLLRIAESFERIHCYTDAIPEVAK
ncbi:MAG: Asp-tRNA(Asn)/Glu-tRNA(Gln) amidotransferase subunit GatA [Verrucomicrobia bacterium]|nr:Asp-tRNA(Asn)/Glu-tRNA(Gln) amidotransferase subunit GatA [Verrucomicrobiota bacterium]